jgi:hypothetical protein
MLAEELLNRPEATVANISMWCNRAASRFRWRIQLNLWAGQMKVTLLPK